MATTLSKNGIATLNYLEGCPLKAYRDVAGVITIGAGLTAASGVIKPKMGMTITQAEADRLLQDALDRNYIPTVIKIMGSNQPQNVIDGAVSFHFNTGGIARASWVSDFKRGNYASARTKINLWRKAAGKVIKGLVKRREIEADMIILGKYPAAIKSAPLKPDYQYASLIIAISAEELKSIQKDFESLGYAVTAGNGFHLDAIKKFQRDNDLNVDGVIGKATLSTLQRQIDARSKTKATTVTTLASGAVGTGSDALGGFDGWTTMIGFSIATIGIIYAVYIAWSYRDVIASKLYPYMPQFSAWLRGY